MIAVLYVDPLGPYPKMTGVDAWDVSRDARLYAGPHAVVAHPPCGPWSTMRHLYQGDELDCAPLALEAVRRWGGVLEHPAHSQLWTAMRMPKPGELPDAFGGWSIAVDQCAWGHVARKRTWLYLVGIDPADVQPRTGGTPTHWASGSRTAPRGHVPPGMKVCSAQQRRRTPIAFAEWLVDLARRCERTLADTVDTMSAAQPGGMITLSGELESPTFGLGSLDDRERSRDVSTRSGHVVPGTWRKRG